MKTKFTFLVMVLLLPLFGFGQYGSSDVKIDFAKRGDYEIHIGHDTFFSRYNTVFIENLPSGTYPVEIFKMDGRRRWSVFRGNVRFHHNTFHHFVYERAKLIVLEESPLQPMVHKAQIMDNQTFEMYLEAFKKFSFTSEKMSFLREQMHIQHFSSAQAATLMEQLAFDSDKLEFAKMVYPKIIDPQNFFLVYEKFSFSSTREQLLNYLESLR